jgi:hypothetical protein
MLSGVHATAGRQVLTWAHEVVAGKSSVVGFPSHSVILCLSLLGSMDV